jgi:trimethylamine--corrinoid protein Co-methyltransferase
VIPRLTLLDQAAREEIHAGTLDVLATTGVKYASARALAVLRGAGATVDDETGVAKLPPRLVGETVARAPRTVLLAGRDPARDVLLDGSRTWLTLDGTGSNTLDASTGERRLSTTDDVARAARIADSLDEVGIVWAPVSPTDADPRIEVLEQLATLLRNTAKHIQPEVQRVEEVPYVMEMLAAASDEGRWDPERPIFSVVYCPISPLQHEREMLDACLELVERGVPMCIYTLATCGATAPVTMAGGVLQTNAEILSAVVLFELVKPGAPVIYTADCGMLDMRSGTYASCGPEAMLMNVALVEMARHYDLPVMATGLTSDAREYSVIAGYEGGASALASMLTQPDLLVGAGLIDSAQMLVEPKLLLDAEIFRQCQAVQRGFAVDGEHLLSGLIAEVGPGGHYLTAKATRTFLRAGEVYQPQAYQRVSYDQWKALGRSDVEALAAQASELPAGHEVKPLPAGAEERFADIMARAAAELGER